MSKCTALTTQQVYKQIQAFLETESVEGLTLRGPAKSSPLYVNGGDSLTLKSGNGVGLSLYPSGAGGMV